MFLERRKGKISGIFGSRDLNHVIRILSLFSHFSTFPLCWIYFLAAASHEVTKVVAGILSLHSIYVFKPWYIHTV